MDPNASGKLIYIGNHLPYETKNDLKIYKSFELESKFIEICIRKKMGITIECIDKHLDMNINQFKDDYLNELFDKFPEENKTIFVFCDFNSNVLNYDIHPPTNEFLDSLSSCYFPSHILQPIRVTTNSKILIDKVSFNMAIPNIVFGNLITSISDLLPLFLLAPNFAFNNTYPK